jgi:hypothetical protein
MARARWRVATGAGQIAQILAARCPGLRRVMATSGSPGAVGRLFDDPRGLLQEPLSRLVLLVARPNLNQSAILQLEPLGAYRASHDEGLILTARPNHDLEL